MNKEKEYELFNTSAPGLTVFSYWGALGVAAGFNAATGHRGVPWLIWLVLAALPLASTTIHRLSLGPEGVVVSYSVAGFIRRTRAFPLRTSVFGWEHTTSFRGGTQHRLSLRAKATLAGGHRRRL
ncbi:hypothetical protein ACVWYF_003912 [Hymenobacter sp. UYAg731]